MGSNLDKVRDEINEVGFLDIGEGAAEHFGMSRHAFQTIVGALAKNGYSTREVTLRQINTKEQAHFYILAPNEQTQAETWKKFQKFRRLSDEK